MVSGFRMASILSLRSRASCPFRPASRIAAGPWCLARSLRETVSPLSGSCPNDTTASAACLAHHRIGRARQKNGLPVDHAKTRAKRRAYFTKSSTANVVLFKQRLVARFVLPLQVVEKRTARGNHFQQAAARMVILHVALEMVGEVVDAFRKDRNLHLGRAGVAGL